MEEPPQNLALSIIRVVLWQRLNGSAIIRIGYQDVANKEKKFPVEWISPEGNNVTVDALNYFLPLIKGEPVLKYKNGIPMHFRIDQ